MPDNDEKLRIALEALLQLKDYEGSELSDFLVMHNIAAKAVREIQRKHYLNEPSPAVQEVLAGAWV